MDGSAGLFTIAEWLNWACPSWGPAYCNSGVLRSRTVNMFPLWNQTCFFPHTLPRSGALQTLTVQFCSCRFLLLKAWLRWGCLDHFNSCLNSEDIWSQLPVWGWLSPPHCNTDSFLSFCWRFAAVCLQTWSSKIPFHHSSSCLPALPTQCMLPAAFALWKKPQPSEIPGDRAAQAEEMRKNCLSSLPN